jgi:phthiocerol/phenolphthiocerol synthesis type-I polyketide synthase C
VGAVYYLHDDIAIVGWSGRFPGAGSISDLWSLLLEGQCAVSRVPDDRFSLQRFGHPRRQERGKSYTWAAGILDDIWGFDPSVFGISPREAEQMDPQQRILLQLTWEALEDAGIPPSSIAGTETGVFVGASQTDYAHSVIGDPAVADSHFATGNSLGVLGNRISYIFDLRGPSVTLDTACSSSLVALHQATQALRSGQIDTAIVAGINIIASPVPFISFAQAAMLSPTGRSRAFSADADGYVRAEGGVVLVLRKAALAQAKLNPVHGLVIASDVNSDGRTNGISVPSSTAQEALLDRVYSRAEIDLDRLLFVEAHGTGTPVGDPIEANALGRSLGVRRSAPLPIGSIKTNIGHLEPASGLAGLVKAVLALNHGILPRSLHFAKPNPNIDFGRLNLMVCNKSLLLAHSALRCAGINSFGFGGTNAHVVVAPGRTAEPPDRNPSDLRGFFLLSAETKPALVALAGKYAERIAHLSDQDSGPVANAAAHRRDRLAHRLVIAATRRADVTHALNAFMAGTELPQLSSGTAIGHELPIAFVYSGNGSQWAGMGVTAYRHNAAFRAQFDAIDAHFKQIAGWSLREALLSESLGERLPLTRIAQPLIFAVQSAATVAMAARGVRPSVVLGHSVGEVAAAEAAGILDLRTAVEVIYARSSRQEMTLGSGRMMAVLAPPDTVKDLLFGVANVEIAAFNSPRAVTVAGPGDSLAELKRSANEKGIVALDLDLDYPFHTALMTRIESHLLADLKNIVPLEGRIPLVSTVTGTCLPHARLKARYWWRNIREPVQFAAAIREAAKLGARFFVEIGPRSTLLRHISDSLVGEADDVVVLSALEHHDQKRDPVDKIVSQALISGARLDTAAVFGPNPGAAVSLPSYPWQQTQFRFTPTTEAGSLVESGRHPFSGARTGSDSLEWYAHIDTALFSELADHRVGEEVIFPGTGFLEIAFAVASEWLRTGHVLLADFQILKPLNLSKDETREVMSRVSPGSNTIEIFSRPRLSQAGWLLHSRAKMLHGEARAVMPEVPPSGQTRSLGKDAIYRMADAGGLHYGPAFRLVERAVIHDNDMIEVELAPAKAATAFALDPVRLDCCGHGILTVFPQLKAEQRGVSYLPVQMDEAALLVPGGVPHSSVLEVVSATERTIVGNYYIRGAANELIAILRGVRFQAVPVKRVTALEEAAFVELPHFASGDILGDTGLAVAPAQFLADALARGLVPTAAVDPDESDLLLEGFATAAAYEIATGLADRNVLEPDALVEGGQLPADLRPWLVNLLDKLRTAGLVRHVDGRWIVVRDPLLPNAASVLKEFAREYPARASDLLVAGAMTGLIEQVRRSRAIVLPAESGVPAAVLEFRDAAGVPLRQSSDLIARLLESEALWPQSRSVRILQVGFGPLTSSLISLKRRRDIDLTVIEPDRRRLEAAQRSVRRHYECRLLDLEDGLEPASYDLILAVESLHRLPNRWDFAKLQESLAARGLLVAIEPRPSVFCDLTLGLDPTWFSRAMPNGPVGLLQGPDAWTLALDRAGFADATVHVAHCGARLASLIIAAARDGVPAHAAPGLVATASRDRPAALIVAAPDAPYGGMLARLLPDRGIAAHVCANLDLSDPVPATVVHIGASAEETGDPVEELIDRCMNIKACAERLDGAATTLWLVFRGALANGASDIRPVETGAWAFSRTLANEFPNLDVRRVDISPSAAAESAALRLRDIVASATKETEIQIDDEVIRAVRVDPLKQVLDRSPQPRADAARLQRRTAVDRHLDWVPTERRAPGPDEIEIAVEATGLNFRDMMWMLSLLSDDVIEDGLGGATLGLECAGRVIRAGASVRHLRDGDRVCALASSAFSTHVTVPAALAAKLPDKLSFEAGATIPVAFLTAYYSLAWQAKLDRGEWVLIHGAAGAVGMAAIQIAQARGARIIATAGSQAKRDLLRALGVPDVLDSRSTGFVEEVRAITGSGVDVVLNSLAGEAMERSIACLRAFGRFVELGKRDYAANTHIGLRPFRKNLTYFGVDLDQLMVDTNNAGSRLYMELMQLFRQGTLTALPYSVFRADDIGEALYLMQHAGHIGKIVVHPPRLDSIRAANPPFAINPAGTHVITGAFGGFGLEAAKWLVARGARHLALVGRQGPASEEAKGTVADFERAGIQVYARSCDVGDPQAVARLFEQIGATMPPVAGVLHAAMVLEDGLLTKLDRDRFARVLVPKVRGAEHLDSVTRGMPLDYFVLFSSATTLMGNPGQANYVAANAYMEGIARRRTGEGQKALAIGWGPITDVGVLARSERLRSRFQKLTGVQGMRAREALDLMGEALALPVADSLAVMTISPSEGLFSADRLPVLKSPTYARFVRDEHDGGEHARKLDFDAIARAEGVEGVRRKLTDVIVWQLARVLRTREEEISRIRPLGEIGLDSLMLLEFAMNFEETFGIHVSVTSSVGALTVTSLANEVISQLDLNVAQADVTQEDVTHEDAAAAALADRHTGAARPNEISALVEIAKGAQTKGLAS